MKNRTQQDEILKQYIASGGKIKYGKPGQSGLDEKVRPWDLKKRWKRKCVIDLNSKFTVQSDVPYQKPPTAVTRPGALSTPKLVAGKA